MVINLKSLRTKWQDNVLLIYTNRVISLATLKLQAAVMIPMVILTSVDKLLAHISEIRSGYQG